MICWCGDVMICWCGDFSFRRNVMCVKTFAIYWLRSVGTQCQSSFIFQKKIILIIYKTELVSVFFIWQNIGKVKRNGSKLLAQIAAEILFFLKKKIAAESWSAVERIYKTSCSLSNFKKLSLQYGFTIYRKRTRKYYAKFSTFGDDSWLWK